MDDITPLTHIRKNVFGLSQKAFADALGVSQAAVSRREKGIDKINIDDQHKIRQLAAARGLAWDDAWFFEVPSEAAA